MTPMQEIKAERRRQIEAEGWTPEHDDQHDNGELLRVAVIYMQNATGFPIPLQDDGRPSGWPWDAKWWKPKTPHRDLVRAGALCLAEKDRCIREGKGRPLAPAEFKLRLIVRKLGKLALGESISWENNLP